MLNLYFFGRDPIFMDFDTVDLFPEFLLPQLSDYERGLLILLTIETLPQLEGKNLIIHASPPTKLQLDNALVQLQKLQLRSLLSPTLSFLETQSRLDDLLSQLQED